MNSTRLANARDFIMRNARLLERTLFEYRFANGPREPVLAALRAYQNADGGFGQALEPDKRCPFSQPADVDTAFRVLDVVDGFEDAMVRPACDFLETITTPEGGVPFTLPSTRDYPHQPWWESADNPPASLNPTASLAAWLLKHDAQHPWLERASAYCWQAIAATESAQYHDLMPIVAFLAQAHAPDRARARRELERVLARVAQPGIVEYDPRAQGYVKMPLDWAPEPSSPLRALFPDDVIAAHLAALSARQQPDGGWPISWQALGPGAGCEWRGWVTLEALGTLQAYESAGPRSPSS